ncbi:MAG: TIGR03862 family flavoprotein [Bacteroidota bacterium]
MSKKTIAIIGGGPSALMLAAQINTQVFDVTVYEKNFAVGRKFLVAGDGGLNITHSEVPQEFINKYTPVKFIKPFFETFNNNDLQYWLHQIGIETFIGSSKRVFPLKELKPIEVLNTIVNEVKQNNVNIQTQYEWLGWNNDELVFKTPTENIHIISDYTVFALGGSSWAKTGSDGTWLSLFANQGIKTIPFQASNCAFEIAWPADFIKEHEGQYLKNIAATCGSLTKKGELAITKLGLEGGAIYALSNKIRAQLNSKNEAHLSIDLKPTLHQVAIEKKLSNEQKSISEILKFDLNINVTQAALLKAILTKEEFLSAEILAYKIKNLPLTVIGTAPIDEAISTVGGIALSEVDANLALTKIPNTFCIGEMLDWDAPTGGYLLQANFSMGYYLAQYFNRIL